MARIEEDIEEGIAEMAFDQRIDLAAGHTDADRLVPFCRAGEVRCGKPVHIVADRFRELAFVRDSKSGARRQRAPEAKRCGERIAALDDAVGRTREAETGPRS